MHGPCVIAKPHSRVDHRERLHTFPSQHAITSATLGACKRGTFDPHVGRFLNTDPVIANILDGQTLNAFSYVGNNPLTLIDPTGFQQQTRESIPEILDTIEQTVVTNYPDGFVPPPMEEDSAETDTGTTGTGVLPQQTPSPEATASPITQFFEGVGERLVGIVPEIAVGILVSNLSAPASTLYRARPGELDTNGAGERAINAINEVNPLYAAGVEIVDGTNAHERGDFVGVGKATLGLGVTVLMVAITLKGARTTRGPPKATDHHVMTNKNNVSTAQGGPWTPHFERMAKKAGMTLEDAANRIPVDGHSAPHPRAYHETVYRRLAEQTEGLSGEAYSRAFRTELARIRAEAATPGSTLNRLIRRD